MKSALIDFYHLTSVDMTSQFNPPSAFTVGWMCWNSLEFTFNVRQWEDLCRWPVCLIIHYCSVGCFTAGYWPRIAPWHVTSIINLNEAIIWLPRSWSTLSRRIWPILNNIIRNVSQCIFCWYVRTSIIMLYIHDNKFLRDRWVNIHFWCQQQLLFSYTSPLAFTTIHISCVIISENEHWKYILLKHQWFWWVNSWQPNP